MRPHRDAMAPNWAERWCWEVARRDDSRGARGVYRQQLGDGVYRREEGALLEDLFPFLQAIGVMALLEEVHGAALPREMVPFTQDVLRDGVKPLLGLERIHALPRLLFSDEALMPLVGFKAQQGRQGICQRGATKRPGDRSPGPIGPDTLAKTIVKWHVRDLEAVFHGAIGAVAKAGVFGVLGTGIADGPDVETTERSHGGGQVTRQVRIEEKRGQVHESDGTVYGGKVLILLAAVTKLPLAVKVVKSHEHEALWTRALVTQARTNLAGYARRHPVGFAQGFGEGTDLWWLDQPGSRFVVPAQANMAVTADARAQAAAGEGSTHGHRVHPVRHGQGNAAWPARRETEVGGITGLTTDDQEGTAAHGRHHNRRDFQPNLSNAVVVRPWHGKDYGPGGKTVFLPTASVEQPLRRLDDDDDRRLIEHGCIKEAKQQWDLGHPPQKPERAVRGPVLCTLLMVARATAYRLECAREDRGGEPVGWHRWRRQLLEQPRDQVLVCAQGSYGILPLAAYSLW